MRCAKCSMEALYGLKKLSVNNGKVNSQYVTVCSTHRQSIISNNSRIRKEYPELFKQKGEK